MPDSDGQNTLRRCMRCARLYRGGEEHQLCHACVEAEAPRHQMPAPLDEDPALPLSRRRLDALMALYDAQAEGMQAGLIRPGEAIVHPAIGQGAPFEAEGECVLCAKPRLQNSDYCLDCQSRLYRELSDAARTLGGMAPPHGPAVPSVRDTLSSLESAHPRPRHVRNNPYPMGRLRP